MPELPLIPDGARPNPFCALARDYSGDRSMRFVSTVEGVRPRHRAKRELLAYALRVSGLGALALRLPCWRGVVALSYHRIGDASQSDLYRSVWSGSSEALDHHLKLVKRHFQVVDPGRWRPELLRQRGRHVMVTFDDGYRDLYESAHPVLQANSVKAGMFLCSGFIDGRATAWWDEIAWMVRRSAGDELPPGPWSSRPLSLSPENLENTIEVATRSYWTVDEAATEEFLERLASTTGTGRRPPSTSDWITWDMARELSEAGHAIGAHTVTHPILSRLPPSRQREEIIGSLDRIEAELGQRPRWLAYPVGTPGAFNRVTREVAHEAGLELAFSNIPGRISEHNFAALDLRRIPVETLRVPGVLSATLALPQLFARS